jgi:phospholipid transport system substrate-binding protein
MVYDAPEIAGDTASIKSVVTILHAMKKQELKLKYKMQKVGADWKVVDVAVLGDSMIKSIREDQIVPIMKEGGWNKLLELLRQKA